MKPLTRVAMVVGEESGDILGAGLIAAIQQLYPGCRFEGIGGERMIALGFQSHFPMERLAVMGLVEPLKRLPELLGIRRNLRQRYSADLPDLFIGIDAPDFNLNLERRLHDVGVLTVHYVSPSVWAWRQGRVKGIARAVDLMLTLFPFEAAFYRDRAVRVACVGHPLADQIPLDSQQAQARRELDLAPSGRYVALLPGSRHSEVEKLADGFLQAARLCYQRDPNLQFLIPAANAARREQLQLLLHNYQDLPVRLSLGNSHSVMAAADAVLMASGTTTLEALLLKRPMVIAYRVAALSYWLLKRLVKSKFIGLPNLLAGRELVPELIQHAATPEALSAALLSYLEQPARAEQLQEAYREIHQSLKRDASRAAAQAIDQLWQSRSAL